MIARLVPVIASLAAAAGLAAEDQPPQPTQPAAQAEPPLAVAPAPDIGRPFGASAVLSAGYDSNILLVPEHDPIATDHAGAAIGVDLTGKLRLIDRPGNGLAADSGHAERLALSLDADVREYPGHQEAETWRIGAQLAGHERRAWGDPGFALGYAHYVIDRVNAADAVNADAFASRIAPSYRHVDVGLLGFEYLRYPTLPDKTGVLGTLAYRHWFLLQPRDIHRRVELGLAAKYYHARQGFESYVGFTPAASAVWRIGRGQRLGTWDLTGAASYEPRFYGSGGGVSEHQQLFGLDAAADAWLTTNASAGVYAGVARRDSNLPINRYDRFQAGARLAATW